MTILKGENFPADILCQGNIFPDFWAKYFHLEFLSKPQLNHNLTQTNITLVGLDVKMTLNTPSHPTETQGQQYLGC